MGEGSLLEVIDLGCGDVLHFGVLDVPLLLGDAAVDGGQGRVFVLAMPELGQVAPTYVCRVVVVRNVHPTFLLQYAPLFEMTGAAV